MTTTLTSAEFDEQLSQLRALVDQACEIAAELAALSLRLGEDTNRPRLTVVR